MSARLAVARRAGRADSMLRRTWRSLSDFQMSFTSRLTAGAGPCSILSPDDAGRLAWRRCARRQARIADAQLACRETLVRRLALAALAAVVAFVPLAPTTSAANTP